MRADHGMMVVATDTGGTVNILYPTAKLYSVQDGMLSLYGATEAGERVWLVTLGPGHWNRVEAIPEPIRIDPPRNVDFDAPHTKSAPQTKPLTKKNNSARSSSLT